VEPNQPNLLSIVDQLDGLVADWIPGERDRLIALVAALNESNSLLRGGLLVHQYVFDRNRFRANKLLAGIESLGPACWLELRAAGCSPDFLGELRHRRGHLWLWSGDYTSYRGLDSRAVQHCLLGEYRGIIDGLQWFHVSYWDAPDFLRRRVFGEIIQDMADRSSLYHWGVWRFGKLVERVEADNNWTGESTRYQQVQEKCAALYRRLGWSDTDLVGATELHMSELGMEAFWLLIDMSIEHIVEDERPIVREEFERHARLATELERRIAYETCRVLLGKGGSSWPHVWNLAEMPPDPSIAALGAPTWLDSFMVRLVMDVAAEDITRWGIQNAAWCRAIVDSDAANEDEINEILHGYVHSFDGTWPPPIVSAIWRLSEHLGNERSRETVYRRNQRQEPSIVRALLEAAAVASESGLGGASTDGVGFVPPALYTPLRMKMPHAESLEAMRVVAGAVSDGTVNADDVAEDVWSVPASYWDPTAQPFGEFLDCYLHGRVEGCARAFADGA
jgi:hypothetical protein